MACLTVVAQLLDLDRDSWPEDRCFRPCEVMIRTLKLNVIVKS